jgi:DNA-binding MarR family transcriptional regulator
MDHVDAILAQWNRERPDLDVAPMGFIARLMRVARHMSREMEATFARHGLNGATFDVLATLRRAGPPHALSPGALMESMMVTSGTVTNRIDQLERAGLVLRAPNPQDGRGFIVNLTEEGLARIDAAVSDHVATQARLVEQIPSPMREVLEEALRHYLDRGA